MKLPIQNETASVQNDHPPDSLPSVLIIEDDYWFAKLFAEAANTQDVRIAGSMAEALDMLAEKSPNYVLLDLSLPDSPPAQTMDLIRSIKHRAGGATLIVITGDNKPETRVRAIQSGADSFLLKGSGDAFIQDMLERVRHGANPRTPCTGREIVEKIEDVVGDMLGLPINLPRQTVRIMMRVKPLLSGA